MKLQLTDSSIRLRLSEEEVRQFDQAGQLAHRLLLGPGQVLSFALVRLPATEAAAGPRVQFVAGELRVELPAAEAHAWARTASISIKGEKLDTNGQKLRILIEKDLGPSH